MLSRLESTLQMWDGTSVFLPGPKPIRSRGSRPLLLWDSWRPQNPRLSSAHKMTQGLKQDCSNTFQTSDWKKAPPVSAVHNPSRDNPHQMPTFWVRVNELLVLEDTWIGNQETPPPYYLWSQGHKHSFAPLISTYASLWICLSINRPNKRQMAHYKLSGATYTSKPSLMPLPHFLLWFSELFKKGSYPL